MAQEDMRESECAAPPARGRRPAGLSADPSAASTSGEPRESSPDRRLLEQFFRELAGRAIAPDWRTNLPGFRHDHDIPWAIEAAAWEALQDAAEKEEAADNAAAPDTMEESADLDPGERSVDEAA